MSEHQSKSKRCTSCSSDKSVNDFYRHKAGLHGVGSECKTCISGRHTRTYDRRENESPDARARRLKNTRAWCAANRAKLVKMNRELQRQHPERVAAYNATRRQRKLNAPGNGVTVA